MGRAVKKNLLFGLIAFVVGIAVAWLLSFVDDAIGFSWNSDAEFVFWVIKAVLLFLFLFVSLIFFLRGFYFFFVAYRKEWCSVKYCLMIVLGIGAILSLLLLTVPIAEGIIGAIHEKMTFPVVHDIEKAIRQSSLETQVAEEVISELEKQAGVKRDKILTLEKLENGEVGINTGEMLGGTAGSGIYYRAKKVDGKWNVEERGMWFN